MPFSIRSLPRYHVHYSIPYHAVPFNRHIPNHATPDRRFLRCHTAVSVVSLKRPSQDALHSLQADIFQTCAVALDRCPKEGRYGLTSFSVNVLYQMLPAISAVIVARQKIPTFAPGHLRVTMLTER